MMYHAPIYHEEIRLVQGGFTMEDARQMYEVGRKGHPDQLPEWDSLSPEQQRAFWEGSNPNRLTVDPRNFPHHPGSR